MQYYTMLSTYNNLQTLYSKIKNKTILSNNHLEIINNNNNNNNIVLT